MKSLSRDTWTGLAMFAVAAVVWHEAGKIRSSPLDDAVGAAGLPKLLAIALMCLSALLVLSESLRALRRHAVAVDGPATATRHGAHAKAAGLFLLGCGYILLVPLLGYAVTIGVFLFCVAIYSGAAFGWRTVLFALAGVGLAYAVFVWLLSIPMPEGRVLLWFAGDLAG